MLHDDIKSEVKEAFKAKDSIKLQTLRAVNAAATNRLIEMKEKTDSSLIDEEIIKIIKKLTKQRAESIKQYKDAGRDEKAQEEQKELEILEKYLPEQMSAEEIKSIVLQNIKSIDGFDETKKGVLIGMTMKKLGAKADGTMVASIVDEAIKNL